MCRCSCGRKFSTHVIVRSTISGLYGKAMFLLGELYQEGWLTVRNGWTFSTEHHLQHWGPCCFLTMIVVLPEIDMRCHWSPGGSQWVKGAQPPPQTYMPSHACALH